MEDVVNRRVSTEATSWNNRTEAAPLRRAPLLLTFICFSSPASRLTLITRKALKYASVSSAMTSYDQHCNYQERHFVYFLHLELKTRIYFPDFDSRNLTERPIVHEKPMKTRQRANQTGPNNALSMCSTDQRTLLCCYVFKSAQPCLRILNQRKSKRPSLKGTLAPCNKQASKSGGKKASRSRTFQKPMTMRSLNSASWSTQDSQT